MTLSCAKVEASTLTRQKTTITTAGTTPHETLAHTHTEEQSIHRTKTRARVGKIGANEMKGQKKKLERKRERDRKKDTGYCTEKGE